MGICSWVSCLYLERLAKKAAKDYSNCDGKLSSEIKSNLLENAIALHRQLLDKLSETSKKYIPTKWTLANYHLEAWDIKMNPQAHLVAAKTLYSEIFHLWKETKPKPAKYPQLLCNLGRVHYDLFEIEPDKTNKGLEFLRKSLEFYNSYNSYLVCDGSDQPTSSEVEQMIRIIHCAKCELENLTINLDGAITHLSNVFGLDKFTRRNSLDDREGWKIASQLTSAIVRNTSTTRVRDLSLLALSQALLYRYNRNRIGDSFDLDRAKAVATVAVSSIPNLSPENKEGFEKVLSAIEGIRNPQGKQKDIIPDSGSSKKASVKTSEAKQSSTAASASHVEASSPQYSRNYHTPITETTSSFARMEPQNSPSRAPLPIGIAPPSSPTQFPRTGQASSSTPSSTQGKPKKPLATQPPPPSLFHTPSKSSLINKSSTSRSSHH